jgi:hypothetical protein
VGDSSSENMPLTHCLQSIAFATSFKVVAIDTVTVRPFYDRVRQTGAFRFVRRVHSSTLLDTFKWGIYQSGQSHERVVNSFNPSP